MILLELTGSFGGAPTLNLMGGNSTVRGLAIRANNAGPAIALQSNGGNTISGNFIGTDATGTVAENNAAGVVITSNNNLIGGAGPAARNVISSSGFGPGISLTLASGNVIRNNYIGTDKNGTGQLGSTPGILVDDASNTIIGGTTPAERNVISGNFNDAVRITGAGANGNVVQGNFIGTNATGTGVLANPQGGVRVRDGATNTTIGGTSAGPATSSPLTA